MKPKVSSLCKHHKECIYIYIYIYNVYISEIFIFTYHYKCIYICVCVCLSACVCVCVCVCISGLSEHHGNLLMAVFYLINRRSLYRRSSFLAELCDLDCYTVEFFCPKSGKIRCLVYPPYFNSTVLLPLTFNVYLVGNKKRRHLHAKCWLKQGDDSILNDGSLTLIDKFIYFGCSASLYWKWHQYETGESMDCYR